MLEVVFFVRPGGQKGRLRGSCWVLNVEFAGGIPIRPNKLLPAVVADRRVSATHRFSSVRSSLLSTHAVASTQVVSYAVFVIGHEEDHWSVVLTLPDVFQGFEAIHRRHKDIEDYHVRVVLREHSSASRPLLASNTP